MRSTRTIGAVLALAAAVLCLAAAAAADDPGAGVPTDTTTIAVPPTTSTAATTTTTATTTTAAATTTTVTDPTATTAPTTTTTAATTTDTAAATSTSATTSTTDDPTVTPRPAESPAATVQAPTTTDETTTTVGAVAPLSPAPSPTPGCIVVGAVGVVTPAHLPRLIGPAATAPPVARIANPAFAYPADGSVVAADSANLSATCGEKISASGVAAVHALSLFGGAVTAQWVSLGIDGTDPKRTFSGVRVDGRPSGLAPGGRVRLGDWGYLEAPSEKPSVRAPAASTAKAPEVRLSSLSVELVKPHAGLPAGTVVLVPYAGVEPAPLPAPTTTTTATSTTRAAAGGSQPSARDRKVEHRAAAKTAHAKRRPKVALHGPLTVTPRLTAGPYLFPLAGDTSYGDSYGGPRSDVPGGWHHGDDLFAPLGTPVVAVADGTLNRVGWERLGGWRLWVRDRAGDEFYYAHMSGYTPLALRGGKVHAGDVLGFVGNTGDAITTLPHLHFEVHPRRLLHLQYDGAVDPTTYLQRWSRLAHVVAPRPVHPRLPTAPAWNAEAKMVFRELLRARGVSPERPAAAAAAAVAASAAPRVLVPFRPPLPIAYVSVPAAATGSSPGPLVLAGIAVVAAAAAAGAAIAVRRRRDVPPPDDAVVAEVD